MFLVLDKADPEGDRGIAEHVLQAHQYRAPGEQEGEAMPLQDGSVLLATCNMDPNAVAAAAAGDAADNDPDLEKQHRKGANDDQVFEEHGGFSQGGGKRSRNT